jgi:hypothetical protein
MQQDQNTAIALEQALALGFESVAAMLEHQRWLEKNGTAEYRAWLATIPTPASVAKSQKEKDLLVIDAIVLLLEKRWHKKGSPGGAVDLFFGEVEAYRHGELAKEFQPSSVLQEGVHLLESYIEDGKSANRREREALARARRHLDDMQAAEVQRIASLVLGDDEGVLDDLIHDECSAKATGINNDGALAQVAFLLSLGWTEAMILKKVHPAAVSTLSQKGSV